MDAAGITRRTLYDARNRYPGFADAWDNAQERCIDSVEWGSTGLLGRARTEKGMPGVIANLAILKAHRSALYKDQAPAAQVQPGTVIQQLNVVLGTAEGRKLAEQLSLQLQAQAKESAREGGYPLLDSGEGG